MNDKDKMTEKLLTAIEYAWHLLNGGKVETAKFHLEKTMNDAHAELDDNKTND